LGGRRINKKQKVHVRLAGLARLAPRLPVRLEVPAQQRDVQVTQPDEEGQAQAGHLGERLRGVGGHAHRRVRHLIRSRGDGDVLDTVELAVIAERLALPGETDDLERLEEARLAFAVGHPEEVVGTRGAAAADPEVEAPLAELIHGGRFLVDAQRVAEWKHLDRDAYAEAPGAGGDEAGEREGGGLDGAIAVEVDLALPDPIEAARLRSVRQVQRLAQRGALADAAAPLLQEDPEMHGVSGPSARASCAGGAPVVKSLRCEIGEPRLRLAGPR